MLQFLSNHFAPHGAGEWAILIVILALCVAGSIAGIKAFGNGFKQQAGTVSITKRGAVTLAFLVGVILVTLTACADTATANKEVDAGGIGSDSQATATATVAKTTLNGKYEETAFVVKKSNEEIFAWAEEFYGLTKEQIDAMYNGKCHPQNYEKRGIAVTQAMRKWLDPNSKGLKNPVSFPLYDLCKAVYEDNNWSQLTSAEQHKIVDEGWIEYDLSSMGNTEQMDSELQLLQDFPILIEQNKDWLPAHIQRVDAEYRNTDEEPVGNAAFFVAQDDANAPLLYDEDYIANQLRVKKLLHDNFELLDGDPIRSWATYKNWWLPYDENADTNRTEPNPNQVWVPSIILVDKYQDAGDGITVGISVFDQRLEEYKDVEAKLVEKEAPPQEETPPGDSGDPGPAPGGNPDPNPGGNPDPEPYTPPATKKDKSKDPVNNGHANNLGIKNQAGSGQGEYQETKDSQVLYPEQGSKGDPSTWENTSVYDPKRQEVSKDPIKLGDGGDKKDSSGQGGQDHNVTDASGGTTHGGSAPNKSEVSKKPTPTNTQQTTTKTEQNSTGGTTTTTETTSTIKNHSSEPVSDDD